MDPTKLATANDTETAIKGVRSAAGKRKDDQAGSKPVLLAGGNPQIAKAEGDAAVQAYIAAMPGWKRDVGRRLDALIERTAPKVRKAVKWNTPFYGIEGRGWFVGFMSLRPVPPEESKQKEARYFHIFEGDQLDEKLLTSWVRQASKLPGWIPG